MTEFIAFMRAFTLETILLRILIATLLGGIIGFERGRHGRAAGLRTHILVCLGAAITTMTGLYVTEILAYSTDPLRIGAQVISGISFLGVGTILVRGRSHVTGLTTAAALWATAAIGLAVGVGFYEGAVIATLTVIITIAILYKMEKTKKVERKVAIYIEINDPYSTNKVFDKLASKDFGVVNLQITPARSGIPNNLGIEASIPLSRDMDKEERLKRISEIENVVFAVFSI